MYAHIDESLSAKRRREIFLALIKAQDRKVSVSESRRAAAERFGIDPELVKEIEKQGFGEEWPPLS